MSDQRLRELERRFRATGAAEDEARWLGERLRRGGLVAERLELAAYLGHPGAVLACREEGLAPPTQADVHLAHLPPEERRYWAHVTRQAELDPGAALGQGLSLVRRPRWCMGLARFGPEVCLRALTAGAEVVRDRTAQYFDLSAQLEVAAAAARGDPQALDRAARLPYPLRTDSWVLPWERLAFRVREVVLAVDADAPLRLCAALSEVLCGPGEEEAFQAAARRELVPWALGR